MPIIIPCHSTNKVGNSERKQNRVDLIACKNKTRVRFYRDVDERRGYRIGDVFRFVGFQLLAPRPCKYIDKNLTSQTCSFPLSRVTGNNDMAAFTCA